jgi:hypothetical protein
MKVGTKDLKDDFPFDINLEHNQIILDSHGINSDEANQMLEGFILEINSISKLGEMESGKGVRTVAVTRDYETSKGLRDIFLFVYIENIGKSYDEEYNQLEGMIIRVDVVESGEVPDTYLDFITLSKRLNDKRISKE